MCACKEVWFPTEEEIADTLKDLQHILKDAYACAGLILDAHALADTEALGNGNDKGALLVILYSISLLGPSSLLYVSPYALYTPIYLASSYCCVCVGIRLYV